MRPPESAPNAAAEAGFTLLELMIVLLVMVIVLAAASSSLVSLSNSTNRGTAMVTEEQAMSGSLAQLARDIRSTHSITFPTGAALSDTADEVILNLNQPGGSSTKPVEWNYQPLNGTLRREVPNSTGVFAPVGPALAGVVNTAGTSVFTFYGRTGENLSDPPGGGGTVGNIVQCATRVSIDLVASPPHVSGVGTITQSEDVALTDQAVLLSQPGNGQC